MIRAFEWFHVCFSAFSHFVTRVCPAFHFVLYLFEMLILFTCVIVEFVLSSFTQPAALLSVFLLYLSFFLSLLCHSCFPSCFALWACDKCTCSELTEASLFHTWLFYHIYPNSIFILPFQKCVHCCIHWQCEDTVSGSCPTCLDSSLTQRRKKGRWRWCGVGGPLTFPFFPSSAKERDTAEMKRVVVSLCLFLPLLPICFYGP